MATIVIVYLGDEPKKVLDKTIATSIICSTDLLDSCAELTCVGENRDNRYYHVHDTNICIMHVEQEFCILVDKVIHGVDIPKFLAQHHYAVYQTTRDWVKNTSTSNYIGYDIKNKLYHGLWNHDYQLDHWAETFNELDKSKRFIPASLNQNGYSHQRMYSISNIDDLNWLCNQIRVIDRLPGGYFI